MFIRGYIRPVLKSAVFSIAVCAVVSGLLGADKNSSFEGTISATLTRAGTEKTQFVFTRKGNQLRIENTTNKLDSINIVDLDGKKLTIIYPHNTTFVHVDLTKLRAQPNFPAGPPGMLLPPGFPTPGSAVRAGLASPATAPPHIGPNPPSPGSGAAGISPPPGFPSPPPMPSMPDMPSGRMPDSAGKMPALPNQMPMTPSPGFGAPGMPPMMGGFGALELKKSDKTKKIQGFDCTLYTLSDRGENFEIWATNDSELFPFRLIEHDFMGHRFGPQMLEETWAELLHNKSVFTLEASLKMEPGGQERLSFKVDKIEKRKIDPPEADKLFAPPEKYIEIQAPQL